MSEVQSVVVVGVDGSESSYRAAEWAAGEARRQGASLRVVYCQSAASLRDRPEARLVSERLLEDAAARARGVSGDAVVVQAILVAGAPAATLVAQSQSAGMLVLGERGRGGAATLLVGSTSAEVAAHAACPVMVVRQTSTAESDSPVLVAVDAAEPSQSALEFAFACAAERGVGLVAVYAWPVPRGLNAYPMGVLMLDLEQEEAAASGKLAEALRPWQELYAQVPVEQRVVRANAVGWVAEASRQGVDVVVVGSRGLAARAGVMLGSVSQGVLRRACRPVVIAR